MVKNRRNRTATADFFCFLFHCAFTVENSISAFAQFLGVKQFLS
ncbi:hypothetical protein HMPREF9503_00720 [Enterococcus faecalis TX0043]|nr:hypothetical protein HMPREF9503_00720 [Enterococcus faecalis TX0043]